MRRRETRFGLDSRRLAAAAMLWPLLVFGCTRAQCPWTRESAELHSDCICDFNPSAGGGREQLAPINRMSVQCAPVNFGALLQALKQTASIELPEELLGPDESDWRRNATADDQQQQQQQQQQAAAAQFISQTKLDLLHLSNVSIGRLERNTFVLDLAQLQRSDGGSVQLGQPSGAGRRLLVVAMQSLHLSRCQIQQIEARAFAGLEWSLTSLSLSDNQLEQVPSSALSSLVNLRLLDLSNNRLLQVEPNAFLGLSRLATLRLADNRLGSCRRPENEQQQQQQAASERTGIDRRAFAGLESCLSDLNLKNAQLSELPEATKHLRRLAFLNLAQNQIASLAPRSFELSGSLTAINLERNRIARLHEDTFVGVEQSLSSLSLLGNLLAEFPVRQLAKLGALRRLDMGFNEIERIPADAFAAHPRLMLVALDGNPIESLPELAFKPLEGQLRGMSVGGKALNCDCRLSWMLRWQREHGLQISSRERQPQFCAKPHYLRSLVSFAALKPEHLTCEPAPATTSAPFVASWPAAGTRAETTSSAGLERAQTSRAAETAPTTMPTGANSTSEQPSSPPPTTATATATAATTTLSTNPAETETSDDDDDSTAGTSEFPSAEATTSLATLLEQLQFGARHNASRSRASSLPEDEIFLDQQPDRKTNRNGYQASGRRDSEPAGLVRDRNLAGSRVSSDIQTSPAPAATTATAAAAATTTATATAARVRGPNSGAVLFGARSIPSLAADVRQPHSGPRRTIEPPNLTGASLAGLVPAIPTTVNVYKQLLPAPSQSQSQSGGQQSALPKGPRLVEEQLPVGLGLAGSAPLELEIGRRSALANQPRPSGQPTTKEAAADRAANAATSSTTITTTTAQPSRAPTEWEQPSSSSVANEATDFGELIAREQSSVTTTTGRPQANNTRVSVSSMYRLASSPKQQQSTVSSQLETTTAKASRTEPSQMDRPTPEAGFRVTTSSTVAPASSAAGTERPTATRASRPLVVSSTRMAATVRFVDSSPTQWPQWRPQQPQQPQQPQPAGNTSSPAAKLPVLVTAELQPIAAVKGPERQQPPSDQQPAARRPTEPGAKASAEPEASTRGQESGQDADESGAGSLRSGSARRVAQGQRAAPTSSGEQSTVREEDNSKGGLRRQPSGGLITRDNSSGAHREARDREQPERAGRLLARLFRLVDVDQLALILAGLLCILILLLALATVCLCCCCGRAPARHRESDSRLGQPRGAGGHPADSGAKRWAGLLCVRSGRKLVTPMRSLILQDDDDSSGALSSGSSGGPKPSAKSMLLAGQSASSPLGQESLLRSVRRASLRLAAARSLQPAGRLVSTMGGRKRSATGGRRRQEARGAGRSLCQPPADSWRVCVLPDEAGSSCDSDKSCSPGANRNNRYDIGQAHRAHLAGQRAIRASRFVSTSEAQTRAGLLRTSESRRPQQQRQADFGLPPADYLDVCSGLSSDKSTTDDSGAPLSSNRPSSFGRPTQTRRAQLESAEATFGAQLEQPRDELLVSADLLPMSAEDEWPEPYVEPEGQQQEQEQEHEERGQRPEDEQRPAEQRLAFVQFEPTADSELDSEQRSQADASALNGLLQQHHHSHCHQRGHFERPGEFLLHSHWHTAGRRQRRAQLEPPVSETEERGRSSLARHRSIPSLQQNHLGASSWLRWAPAIEGQQAHARRPHRRKTADWNGDNQLESILVANKQPGCRE